MTTKHIPNDGTDDSHMIICRLKGKVAKSYCQFACTQFDAVKEHEENNKMLSHGNSIGVCRHFGRVDRPLGENEILMPQDNSIIKAKTIEARYVDEDTEFNPRKVA